MAESINENRNSSSSDNGFEQNFGGQSASNKFSSDSQMDLNSIKSMTSDRGDASKLLPDLELTDTSQKSGAQQQQEQNDKKTTANPQQPSGNSESQRPESQQRDSNPKGGKDIPQQPPGNRESSRPESQQPGSNPEGGKDMPSSGGPKTDAGDGRPAGPKTPDTVPPSGVKPGEGATDSGAQPGGPKTPEALSPSGVKPAGRDAQPSGLGRSPEQFPKDGANPAEASGTSGEQAGSRGDQLASGRDSSLEQSQFQSSNSPASNSIFGKEDGIIGRD